MDDPDVIRATSGSNTTGAVAPTTATAAGASFTPQQQQRQQHTVSNTPSMIQHNSVINLSNTKNETDENSNRNTRSTLQQQPQQQLSESTKSSTITTSTAAASSSSSSSTTSTVIVHNNSNTNNKCLQTPHTMRLLKLIRDGNVEFANMAVERLNTYCATIVNSGSHNNKNNTSNNSAIVIIWDLIGRLQSLLTVAVWSTRQVASYAIYIVAQYLSIHDQTRLFSSTLLPTDDQEHDNTATTSSSTPTTTGLPKQSSSSSSSSFVYNKEYLSVSDLLETNGTYSMANVVRQGQELYSVPESQFTTTTNKNSRTVGNTNLHDNRNSDAVDNDDDDSNDANFVVHRIRQQRQLLATRLGLGMMADVINAAGGTTTAGSSSSSSSSSGCVMDGMIPNLTSDDLAVVEGPSSTVQPIHSLKSRNNRKRQRYAEQIHHQAITAATASSLQMDTTKLTGGEMDNHQNTLYNGRTTEAQQQYDADVQDALETTPNPNTIRAMLVRQVVRQQQQTEQSVAAGTTTSNHTADGPPQTPLLFATELLYRMFHPVWYVRHGALLGILALLRAYIHSRSNKSSSSVRFFRPSDKYVFGTWLHDLLTRCICVIALDRFGDFGGSNNSNSKNSAVIINANRNDDTKTDTSIHSNVCSGDSGEFKTYTTWTNNSGSGSVVAPVREVCGQVIAILHGMTKLSKVAEQTRTVLFQLCEYESSWEIRHGALIAFKYLVVVELTDMLQDQDETMTLDVADGNIKSTRDNVKDSGTIKWIEAICSVAMAHLSDCNDEVKSASAHLLIECCCRSHPEDENFCFIWDVVSPLWCALQKVRRFSSCIVDLVELCTILVARNCQSFLTRLSMVTSKNFDADPKMDDTPTSIFSLIQFLMSLLDSEFSSVRTSALQSIGVLCAELGTANVLDLREDKTYVDVFATLHDLAIHILKLSADETSDENKDNYSISCDGKMSRGIVSPTWVLICNAIVRIVKPNDWSKVDVTLLSWYFQIGEERVLVLSDVPVRLHAAKALAYYLSKSCSCGTISDVAQTFMLACISSPWTTHVESACLLHMELAKCLTDRSSLKEFESRISLEVTMTCLSLNVWNLTINLSLTALCDQTCLSMSSEVINGSKTPIEGSNHVTHLWSKQFALEENHHSALNSRPVCPFTEMRLLSVVAGSMIARGLPSKLTPVVRALMTFFHNETTSRSRGELVAAVLIHLLQLTSADTKFANAYTKIVSTLCDSIAYRSCGGQANNFRSTLATTILQSMVNQTKSIRILNDITPVWQRLQPVMTSDLSNSYPSAALLDAMDILVVLLGGLSNEHSLIDELIASCIPALLNLLANDAASKRAVSTIVALCEVSPRILLEAAIPSILRELDDATDGNRRLAACGLLQKLVVSAATYVCPFVKLLLPRVLLLMSGNVIECSQCASNIFASLIKVAPLVQQSSLKSDPLEDSRYGSVIDHLIFGKSLPPCQFPKTLSSALIARGIKLRKYQEDGVSWLHFLQSVNLNGALCDDMGTGKSLQTLVAIALAHMESGGTIAPAVGLRLSRSLIICPSTLVCHWVGEIEKHFPLQSIFTPLCLSGGRSERLELWRRKSNAVNVVITSYAVLRSDIEYLERENWCYCVLDEGHLLKNPKTATARSSRRLRAKHKLVLTGTLIQNRVHELWATFDFLMPSFLGSSKEFAANYANPIARSQLPNASASTISDGMNKLKLLHQQVLPFILRREKRQVLPELPQMSQTILKVPLSSLQQHMYSRFCAARDVDVSFESLEATFTKTIGSGQSGGSDVLKSLVFLRLLCTHPSLVLSELQLQSCPDTFFAASSSGKMMALLELLKGVMDYKDNMNGADNDISLLYCDDDTDDQDAYTSVLDVPDPCLSELKTIGEGSSMNASSKCLIFAQFTKSLDAVENLLFKTHMPTLRYCRLDGSVPQNKRIDVVNLFQNDPTVRVMLLTTRVGGIGLNLTAASTVIFLEVDFNPYADFQAQDRCMRIGQTQSVHVYRIIAKDSIEENILKLQDKKIQVTEAIVNSDNSTMYSMGTERLLDLFDIDEKEGQTFDFDYDLEGVVEKCADDYKNLAVDTFTNNFLR